MYVDVCSQPNYINFILIIFLLSHVYLIVISLLVVQKYELQAKIILIIINKFKIYHMYIIYFNVYSNRK